MICPIITQHKNNQSSIPIYKKCLKEECAWWVECNNPEGSHCAVQHIAISLLEMQFGKKRNI